MAYFPRKRSIGGNRKLQRIFENKELLPVKEQTEELNEATINFMKQFLPEAFHRFLSGLGPLRPTNPCDFIMESAFLLGQNPYQHYPALLKIYTHAVEKLPKPESGTLA